MQVHVPAQTPPAGLLLLLDTEGLMSIEASGQDGVLDTQLALMAMACSHLVIVNHKGELSRQLQDLLEVCLFALKHLQVPHARAVRKPRRDCLTGALFGTHLGQ